MLKDAPASSAVRTGAVFVSYSRRDYLFVSKLSAALTDRGRDAWVDRHVIPHSASWWEEIAAGIRGADVCVFVLSPDALRSDVCARELAYALDSGKRIVPLLHRDVRGVPVPEALASRQWLIWDEQAGFDAAVEALVAALNTDPEWLHAHTRLLVRASEWEHTGRDGAASCAAASCEMPGLAGRLADGAVA